MSVEEDIQKFEEWALQMGCSAKALPPRTAMRRIFQSGQALAFREMMRRVRPVQEIQMMKDNIMVHNMRKIMESKLPPSLSQDVPEPLRRYLAIEKSKVELKETEVNVAQKKADYLKLKSWVNEKNIERTQKKEELANLQAKFAILSQKEEELDAELLSEMNNSLLIRSATPLKIDGTNVDENRAKKAIEAAVAELKAYYLKCDNNGDASDANREELWHKMHDIFADIPNYILWNNLLAMKDRQLVEIGVMSRMNIANLLKVSDGPTGSASTQSTASSYKIAIGKMYALHVSLMVDMHLGKMEKQKLVTDYVMAYNTFESNIQTKYELFNKNEVAHELLVAYVTQFSTMCYNQAQIEYLERAIAENDNEIMERTEALKDHSALTNSYRCICNEIEDLYCKTQEDMRSLSSVKDKIKVNEDYLRYLIEKQNDMDAVKILGTAAGNTNEPANSSSSNFGSDESFTSNVTLDSTGNRPDVIVSRSKSTMPIPQLLKEFKMFLDVPISKFKRNFTVENALELEENALFHPSLINTMPKPMQDLIPGHSMTSNAFLKYLHNLQAWKQQQQYFLANIEIDMKPIEIDEEQLAKMKCRQIEEITEIIDETTHIAQIRDVCLQRLGKYMEFLKTNPLRKYIPKSRLFNGRSYQEYEEEFMLYYNIVVAHKAQN